MTVRRTKRADLDIEIMYLEGVQLFGIEQAERYQDGLFRTFQIIAANPFIARLRQEFRPPVRIHPYGSHMIIYIEDAAGILVVRVLHGRQAWDKLLS
ncbi:type II toxin-antitoxin system RelE/ParE family toxin [Methylobacterium sp. JK268]